MTAPTFYWHVHHQNLCEMLTEPVENRIAYIKANKPKSEIETRLRLLKPVQHPERLPAEWVEAHQKWVEAYKKWVEAYKKRGADQKFRSQIEALHREECPDCPWDGKTILPKGRVV